MVIEVFRVWHTPNSVCGMVSLNGVFFCYSLEPPKLDPPIKPRAIPPGTYQYVTTHSPRLGYMTPLLVNVPDFTEIRWHIGNSAKDTDGCLLVGETHAVDWVGNSEIAFTELMKKIPLIGKISYFELA